MKRGCGCPAHLKCVKTGKGLYCVSKVAYSKIVARQRATAVPSNTSIAVDVHPTNSTTVPSIEYSSIDSTTTPEAFETGNVVVDRMTLTHEMPATTTESGTTSVDFTTSNNDMSTTMRITGADLMTSSPSDVVITKLDCESGDLWWLVMLAVVAALLLIIIGLWLVHRRLKGQKKNQNGKSDGPEPCFD